MRNDRLQLGTFKTESRRLRSVVASPVNNENVTLSGDVRSLRLVNRLDRSWSFPSFNWRSTTMERFQTKRSCSSSDNEKTSCFVFRASALTLKPLISGLSGHGFGVRIRSSQCDNNLLLTAAISLISLKLTFLGVVHLSGPSNPGR